MPLDPTEEGPAETEDEEAERQEDDPAIINNTVTSPPITEGGGEFADADETLAGEPNVQPAATPGTVVTPPATPTTPEQAGAGSFAASQEEIQRLTDKAAAGQELDDIERQRLQQAGVDDRDIQVQRELNAQAQLDARNEFQAKKDAADEKVRDFKFHDYFDNPAHGSKALARFAVFLGGLGNLGGQAPGSPNRALDGLEQNIRADHEEQLAYLNSAKYFADKQAEGYTDLLKQQQSDRQQLELDYANKKLATADKFAELAQTARSKVNYDAAMVEVAKLKKSAYDDQQKVFNDIAKQKYEDARAQYQLHRARKGGGGGGSNPAFDAFVAAASELKPGDPITPEVAALALKAGIKKQAIPAQVKQYAAGIPKGKGTEPKPIDPTKIVRDLDGTELGYAPSGRGGAAALQSDLRTNQQALGQLNKLLNKNYTTKFHPEFHDAVLALAAVTTAGKTDKTTEHEEGAITNAIGMPSESGIRDKIKQIQDRIDEIKAQLAPLPPKASAPTSAQSAAMDRLMKLGVQFGAPQ